MKITRNTPDQLILAYVPWVMSILLSIFILIFVGVGMSMVFNGELIGLLFTVLGGGIGGICFISFVRRVQVIFDRPNQTFTLRRRTVFGYKEKTRALGDVDEAIIEHTTNSDGKRLDRPTVVLHRARATCACLWSRPIPTCPTPLTSSKPSTAGLATPSLTPATARRNSPPASGSINSPGPCSQ